MHVYIPIIITILYFSSIQVYGKQRLHPDTNKIMLTISTLKKHAKGQKEVHIRMIINRITRTIINRRTPNSLPIALVAYISWLFVLRTSIQGEERTQLDGCVVKQQQNNIE